MTLWLRHFSAVRGRLWEFCEEFLAQHALDGSSRSGDAGQPLFAPARGKREIVMVEAQGRENGGVQVANRYRLIDDIVAVVVGHPVTASSTHATAGQPASKAARMMITAIVS